MGLLQHTASVIRTPTDILISSCQVPAMRESLSRGVDWAAMAAQQQQRTFAKHALRPSAARLERLIAAVDRPDVQTETIAQVDSRKPSNQTQRLPQCRVLRDTCSRSIGLSACSEHVLSPHQYQQAGILDMLHI